MATGSQQGGVRSSLHGGLRHPLITISWPAKPSMVAKGFGANVRDEVVHETGSYRILHDRDEGILIQIGREHDESLADLVREIGERGLRPEGLRVAGWDGLSPANLSLLGFRYIVSPGYWIT